MSYNFVVDSFNTRNFVTAVILYRKRPYCVFEPPLGDLGASFYDHLRLVGKRVLDFLLVLK